MKKLFSLLLLICILFSECKKDKQRDLLHNITLYNQPLDVIQDYVRGKWYLHYAYGGWNGTTRVDYTNWVYDFSKSDSIIIMDNDSYYSRSKLLWIKREYNTPENASGFTYTMNFENFNTVSWEYGVQEIKNDTLVLFDFTTDGFGYYLTRIK